jgi:hypothetical protein
VKTEDQRNVTVGSKSFDAMWAEFAHANGAGEQPAGSISAQQYADRFGVTIDRARHKLRRQPSKLVKVSVGRQVRAVRFYFPPKHKG